MLNYILSFLLVDFILIIGYMVGSWVAKSSYENKQWELLEYSAGILGYRKMSPNSKVKKGGKYMLAVELRYEELFYSQAKINEDDNS